MDLMALVPDGFKRAIAAKAARWVGTLAGGAVFGFLLSHSQVTAWLNQACASMSSADALKEFAGGAAVALLALFSSIKDAKSVNGKIATAAAAGYDKGQTQAIQKAMQQGVEVQATADETKIEAVADAMKTADTATKTDKANLVAAIKSGSF